MSFLDIYKASLDPTRLALFESNYVDISNKNSANYNPVLAKSLLSAALASGYPIDFIIQMNHWDPETTMAVRANDGYAWVPAYGQPNINIAPGLSLPGVPSNYTTVAPPGSIKVSTDPADYPAFAKAIIVPTSISTQVGPLEFSAAAPGGKFIYYYGVVPGDSSPVGTHVVFEGDNFTKVVFQSQGMPGFQATMIIWQLNQPIAIPAAD